MAVIMSRHRPLIAEPIPMKRELKHISTTHLGGGLDIIIAEPIPMKRELKHGFLPGLEWRSRLIAEPIPMKRELKRASKPAGVILTKYCRAYPDEKGIETNYIRLQRTRPIDPSIAEPIPMKREFKHQERGNYRLPNNPNCVSSQDRIPSYSPHQPILAFYHRLHGLVLYSLTA